MVSKVRIVPLRPADLDPLLDHLERLAAYEGSVFARRSEGRRRWQHLSSRPEDAGWRRAWGAVDDGAIVGHAEVICAYTLEEEHRARLEVVVEPSRRRQGVGTALVTAALAWCEAHPFLEWVDLRLTDRDMATVSLAQRAGFVVAARLEDRYRDADGSVATLWLTRRVNRWKAGAAVRSKGAGDVTLRFSPRPR